MSLALRDGSEKRLRELDGWRAVSVLFVILHHIAGYQHRRLVSQFSFLDLRVSHIGPLGVDIFFVISGFVICRILVLEELRYGSVSLKGFYCRRIFRILPPFYIYLAALSALLCLGLIHESWRAILCSALFLFDIKGTPSSWFVGHTWSLALEEQFYLIFPTMWVLTPKSWKGQVFLGVFFLISAWNLSMVYTKWDTLTSAHTRVGFGCICCGVLMARLMRHVCAPSQMPFRPSSWPQLRLRCFCIPWESQMRRRHCMKVCSYHRQLVSSCCSAWDEDDC